MRIFAVGTKIFGGAWPTFGGPVPPRPQRTTAPGCNMVCKLTVYRQPLVRYKIFINKQNIKMFTITLALYSVYPIIQFNLSCRLESSHAMRAGDAWIE